MEKQTTGVGRRKEAVTRVFVSKGSGAITINDKDYKAYFPLVYLQNQVERPLKTVDVATKYDVKINAAGGGASVQIFPDVGHQIPLADREERIDAFIEGVLQP